MKIIFFLAFTLGILSSCGTSLKTAESILPYTVKSKDYDLKFQGSINSFFIELDETCKNIQGLNTNDILTPISTEMMQSETLKETTKEDESRLYFRLSCWKKQTDQGKTVMIDLISMMLVPESGYQPFYAGQLTYVNDEKGAQSVKTGMTELVKDFKRVKKEKQVATDVSQSICWYYVGVKYNLAKFRETKKYIVPRLVEGSPIDRAGIKVGDELISADKQPMNVYSETGGAAKAYKAKKASKFVINRNGKAMNFAVKPVYKCL